MEHLFEEVNIADPPISGYDPLDEDSGFLYKFTNLANQKIYLGIHKGRVDDGYWNSSENDEFRGDFGHPDSTWKYEVLDYGSYIDMTVVEHTILKQNKAVKNDKFYNDSNGSPMKKMRTVSRLEIKRLAEEINSNEYPTVMMDVEELLNKDNCRRLQSRAIDSDENIRDIKTDIDDNAGRTKDMDLWVVLVEDRTYQGINKQYWLVGGNHTLQAVKSSKHGTHVKAKIIPKSVHENFCDSSLKSLSNSLNKRSAPRDQLKPADAAKELFEMYVDLNQPINDPENDELLKDYGFNSRQRESVRKQAKVLVDTHDDEMIGKVWINWKTPKYEPILNGMIEDRRDKFTMVLTATSGKFNIGTILSKVRHLEMEALANKRKPKKKLVIFVTHPNKTSRDKWNTHDLKINQEDLMCCLDDKNIDLQFDYPKSYESDYDTN